MNVQFIYIFSYLLAGVILTAMIAYLWIFRKLLMPGYSLLMFIAIWIWLVAQLAESLTLNLEAKLFFNNARFIGIVVLPPAWITFCVQYISAKVKQIHRIFLFLFFISFILLILIYTNEFHHLIWKNAYLGPNNLLIEKEITLGYYFLVSYLYVLIISGYLLLFSAIRPQAYLPYSKIVTLLLITILPLLTNVVDLFFKREINYYAITPLGFALSSLSFIYYLRLRYYKVIPITQHAVIESMNDLIIILSPENRIIYVNPAVNDFFAAQSPKIIGKHLSQFSSDLFAIVEKAKDFQHRSEEITFNDTTLDASISPILNWRGRLISKILVLRNITRLKQTEQSLWQMKNELERGVQERTQELNDANKALKTSLEEKNMLLGELHHRVKNNFQLISSMLKLQSYRITDPKAMEVFSTAINRIYSIAMIHEKLYRTEDFVNTKFSEYVKDLTQYIISSYGEDSRNISLKTEVEPVLLDLDRSILCGLIINELVINALKHAFPVNKKKKEIVVSFSALEDHYVLRVFDNGIGLSPQFDIQKSDSLGMKIIQTLTKQIKGSIELNCTGGTEFKIIFLKHD